MTYDATTALIVVDVQNDFADPDGSLFVTDAPAAIPFINDQAHAAAEAGATVVYTQDWHPPHTPHFETDGGPWPVHCVADSWGARLHPDLDVVDEAVDLRKGTGGEDGYSAFSLRDPETGEETPTGLADQLRDRDIERVVVAGLALDYCVKETALDAARLGFDTTLLADGTRPVNLEPGDGARAVAELVEAGVEVA
ncbi:MAG: isochorismatase family protein [Acidimicrobiia bacterium]